MSEFNSFPDDVQASLCGPKAVLRRARKEITEAIRKEYSFPLVHNISNDENFETDRDLIHAGEVLKKELEERGFKVEIENDLVGDCHFLVAIEIVISMPKALKN